MATTAVEGGQFKKFKGGYESKLSATEYWKRPKAYDDSVIKTFEQRFQPSGGLPCKGGPLRFTLNQTHGNLFTDLFNTKLLLTMKMEKNGGSEITQTSGIIGSVPINTIFYTYFRDVIVRFNGVQVSGANNGMYGYKNWLRTKLSYSSEWKGFEGLQLGYYDYDKPTDETPKKAESQEAEDEENEEPLFHLEMGGTSLRERSVTRATANHWSDGYVEQEDQSWWDDHKQGREYLGRIGADIFNAEQLV